MTQAKQSDGTLVRRDGNWLRFSKDGGVTWSGWHNVVIEALPLRVLHRIEVE